MIRYILMIFSIIILSEASWAQKNLIPDVQQLSQDTPTTTTMGNQFTAPADWYLTVRDAATFIEAPEGGSRIVLVDVQAENDSIALSKGWAAYKDNPWKLKDSNKQADRDGWSERRSYEYLTSPNEKRTVVAGVMYANDVWTVWIYDMAHDVGGKRSAQVNLIFSSLLPKGYSRETFAGKEASKLDEERITELTTYIENAIKTTGVPGVGLGIIQNGKVVFAGGFGVRELGKKEKIDEETLFIIASNTKALTTLLLAKLIDAGKMSWTTPVTDLMPNFKLGSEKTTKRTLVEHLVCACTGLPRKDMELIFEFGDITAAGLMQRLAETEPTTDFGEMFQYSNSLAAAAGYVAGHILYPDMEIGAAYDKAMQIEVFDPLDMKATTFNYQHSLASNHASAHGIKMDGETGLIDMRLNYSVIHARPAGAAWSNVNDMLKYIQMELNEGSLGNGIQYISREVLLERRVAKVPISQNAVYGMGLMVDETYGTQVVHHGGDVFGHHSDMMWLPEHGVGAVVLTNGDPGWIIRNGFQRKLLEVLFDGKPEADEALALNSKRYYEQLETSRKLYTIPADITYAQKLASQYMNESLGKITVQRSGSSTFFDFGEWRSEVGSQQNPDGTISFVTIDPGINGFEFVVGSGEEPQLIMRDAQHEYLFRGN